MRTLKPKLPLSIKMNLHSVLGRITGGWSVLWKVEHISTQILISVERLLSKLIKTMMMNITMIIALKVRTTLLVVKVSYGIIKLNR